MIINKTSAGGVIEWIIYKKDQFTVSDSSL